MTRLRGGCDDLCVVAVGKYGTPAPRAWPSPADRRIEMLRGGNLKSLHARAERMLVAGFDDQVDVVVLDAEMDDAEALAPRSGQRGFVDRLIDAAPAQVADRADRPQCDVHGV